jgi:hypothetical protein
VIGISIHQSCNSSHASSPNADTAHSAKLSQILEDAVHIVSLVIPQRNVFTLRQPTTCEIEGKNCDVSAE